MSLDTYTTEELQQIVKRHTEMKEYQCEYKRQNPASSEQRKAWNKRYYENRKNRADFKEKQKEYYENGRARAQHSSRHYYYKKNGMLEKLKEKYPETYNIYYNTNVISGLHD